MCGVNEDALDADYLVGVDVGVGHFSGRQSRGPAHEARGGRETCRFAVCQGYRVFTVDSLASRLLLVTQIRKVTLMQHSDEEAPLTVAARTYRPSCWTTDRWVLCMLVSSALE